jgi:hypothetical protein
MSTQTNKISVEYRGSKGWLIFWVFVFFPIALTLLAISGKFQVDGKTYRREEDTFDTWFFN